MKMTVQLEALHRLVWHTAFVVFLHHTTFLYLVQSQGCCDVKLMDASQQVAIDTGRPLTAGTYRGLSVRFCTTDRVYIQIWNMISSSTVQLKWQTAFTPTQNQQSVKIDLSLNPISIGDNDRLGLYSQLSGSNSTKIAVPYGIDTLFDNMQFTQSRFPDATFFTLGLQANLTSSSTQLKRTFGSFVRLCTSSDCSDQPADSSTSSSSNVNPPYCACPASCSPDTSFLAYTTQYQTLTQTLSSQISSVQQTMQNLLSTSANTGICPNGTVSGPYGTGSCYVVVPMHMAQNEATMYCQVFWPTSKLVDIYSENEESFIYDLVSNYTRDTGVKLYWSSGIYSFESNQYVWGQSDVNADNVNMIEIGFLDFANNNANTPANEGSVCVLLSVDVASAQIYWLQAECSQSTYFICKMPKDRCF